MANDDGLVSRLHPALRDPSDRPALRPSPATKAFAQTRFLGVLALFVVGTVLNVLGASASPLRALLGALRARR